jgi:hypothetical protein
VLVIRRYVDTLLTNLQAEYWQGVSDTAKDFVRACLTVDPTNRPTAAELLGHPWLKTAEPTTPVDKGVDLLPSVKSAFNAKKTCECNQLCGGGINHILSCLAFVPARDDFADTMLLSPKGCAGYDGDAQAARWTAEPLDRRADSRGEGEVGARGGAIQEGGRAGAWFPPPCASFGAVPVVFVLPRCSADPSQEDVQSVLATPAQTA